MILVYISLFGQSVLTLSSHTFDTAAPVKCQPRLIHRKISTTNVETRDHHPSYEEDPNSKLQTLQNADTKAGADVGYNVGEDYECHSHRHKLHERDVQEEELGEDEKEVRI